MVAVRPLRTGGLICGPLGTVRRQCRHRGVARRHPLAGQNHPKVERHCLRKIATCGFRGFQDQDQVIP